MAAIALFGIVAYRGLAVSDLPNVDYPTLNVSASLPGGDPATMASAVATPLERQFTGIAGLDSMTSSSSFGNCNITLQFSLDRDMDGAAVDVQTAIAEAMPLLPAGMPLATVVPQVQSSGPARSFQFAVTSQYASRCGWWTSTPRRWWRQRISMVDGVAQVQVYGGSQKYAVRVQVEPDALPGTAFWTERSYIGHSGLER